MLHTNTTLQGSQPQPFDRLTISSKQWTFHMSSFLHISQIWYTFKNFNHFKSNIIYNSIIIICTCKQYHCIFFYLHHSTCVTYANQYKKFSSPIFLFHNYFPGWDLCLCNNQRGGVPNEFILYMHVLLLLNPRIWTFYQLLQAHHAKYID